MICPKTARLVEAAVGRDVLALGAVRRPALLRQVFAIAVSSPAQIVSLQKPQGQLQEKSALETVARYLRLLEDAYLVVALEKYSTRVHRSRVAPPKLVTLNNALLFGHARGRGRQTLPANLNVSACGLRMLAWRFVLNQGQRVTYWRAELLEVDAVIEGN